MHSNLFYRSALGLLFGAGLLVALPAAAHATQAPSALCGGDKKKDVKKPTDDTKKPSNPA